jgi:hypothetical protein
MRRLILALELAALTATAALAEGPRNPAIEGTIQRQIDAFLVDDFATAFTFASPSIKGMLGTPDRFGTMVRQGYPMVWRPGAVRFLDLREVGGRQVQRVMITDQAGAIHMLEYYMIEGPEGWQINGAQLLPGAQVGA